MRFTTPSWASLAASTQAALIAFGVRVPVRDDHGAVQPEQYGSAVDLGVQALGRAP